MSAETDQLLLAMEQAKTAVATLTGMKQQFVDAGWDERHAESAVLTLLASSLGKQATP